jgi:hypothetical protein
MGGEWGVSACAGRWPARRSQRRRLLRSQCRRGGSCVLSPLPGRSAERTLARTLRQAQSMNARPVRSATHRSRPRTRVSLRYACRAGTARKSSSPRKLTTVTPLRLRADNCGSGACWRVGAVIACHLAHSGLMLATGVQSSRSRNLAHRGHDERDSPGRYTTPNSPGQQAPATPGRQLHDSAVQADPAHHTAARVTLLLPSTWLTCAQVQTPAPACRHRRGLRPVRAPGEA